MGLLVVDALFSGLVGTGGAGAMVSIVKDWVALSPAERRVARARYEQLKKLTPEQKTAIAKQWQEYRRSLAQSDTPFDPDVSDAATTTTPERQ